MPISKPLFDAQDGAGLLEVLRGGWVAQGPKVGQFESDFASYTDLEHCVAVSSGTAALHLALTALGLGPGDEVLVPAFTWIATANVVRHVGATPVFIDIALETYNLDPEALLAAITPRTRAVIPVHLFGNPVDMDQLLVTARQHGLYVIEDAACGFGTRWNGRQVGTLGDAGCFSFHPRKAITTGEGGMVATADEQIARAIRSLRDHGVQREEAPSAAFLLPPFGLCGFNYRLTDLQAALGCSQLDKADAILRNRRRVAEGYAARLAGRSWLRLPTATPGGTHSWQAYVCLFAPVEPSAAGRADLMAWRNAIMAELAVHGIATRPGTHSVPHTRLYKSGIATCCPRALLAESLSIALPLYPQMADEDLDVVTAALDAAYAKTASATPHSRIG